MDTSETLNAAINKNTTQLDQKVDQASAAAHKVITDAVSAAHPAVQRLNQTAHQTVDKFMRVASTTAETVANKSEQLMDAQERLTEECRVYIRQKPVTAMAMALGVGYLLSRLLTSKK
jgi:ElaB/YqjD/DUF883 family membrane-anchored ribosome-binding protein